MTQQGGVSGVGVAVATGGALLIYAGLRDVSPLEALRDVASGRKPKAIPDKSAGFQELPSDMTGEGHTSRRGSDPGSWVGVFPQLPRTIVANHGHEQYSQARRWESGYSDCSSIIGKSLRDLGIKPPGASTTWSYLGWSELGKISRGDVGAGDLIVNQSHIITAVSNKDAVGQQNSSTDVRIGPIEDLMKNTGGGFVCLRFKSARTNTAEDIRLRTQAGLTERPYVQRLT